MEGQPPLPQLVGLSLSKGPLDMEPGTHEKIGDHAAEGKATDVLQMCY